jgi:hypothetical protein
MSSIERTQTVGSPSIQSASAFAVARSPQRPISEMCVRLVGYALYPGEKRTICEIGAPRLEVSPKRIADSALVEIDRRLRRVARARRHHRTVSMVDGACTTIVTLTFTQDGHATWALRAWLRDCPAGRPGSATVACALERTIRDRLHIHLVLHTADKARVLRRRLARAF